MKLSDKQFMLLMAVVIVVLAVILVPAWNAQ